MSLYFPDIINADENGLLAQGGSLESNILIDAYSHGIFPWPSGEGEPILWFAPPMRGVLFFDELHLPRRFQSWYKRHPFRITYNTAFHQLINECAQMPRPDDQGTWITSSMIHAYIELSKKGYIQSCEVWDGSELVGGIYGVFLNGHFSGESMFMKKSNASKLALVEMIYHLKKMGLSWIDTQMTTSIIAHFGGKEIPRDIFMAQLKKSAHR